MAIDSRNKRFSFVNFGQSTGVLANPDGSVDAADRAMALGLYPNLTNPAILEIIQFSAPGTALLELSAPGVTLLQIKSSYN